MPSRENLVLLASTTLVVVCSIALVFVGVDDPLIGVLVVPGVGILAPQLYLAVADSDVPARTRIRFGVVASLVLLWSDYSVTRGGRRTLLVAVAAVLFLALVGYEFTAGYRQSQS